MQHSDLPATQDHTRPDPIKASPPYLLQLAARLQSREYMRRIADLDLQPAETYVLHELFTAEPLTQSDLSRRLDIGHAAIGQTLRRLERKHFIDRIRDPADLRTIRVSLTPKGRSVQEPLWSATRELTCAITTGLGDDGAELGALLARLVTVLESLERQPPKR
jgi:DNA-binding MarR family transcriptional regulator